MAIKKKETNPTAPVKKTAPVRKSDPAKKAVKTAEPKKKDAVVASVSLEEVKDTVSLALNLRFLFLTMIPEPKKGTRGADIVGGVDKCGQFLRSMAERLGVKVCDKVCKNKQCQCKKTAKKTATKKEAK